MKSETVTNPGRETTTALRWIVKVSIELHPERRTSTLTVEQAAKV